MERAILIAKALKLQPWLLALAACGGPNAASSPSGAAIREPVARISGAARGDLDAPRAEFSAPRPLTGCLGRETPAPRASTEPSVTAAKLAPISAELPSSLAAPAFTLKQSCFAGACCPLAPPPAPADASPIALWEVELAANACAAADKDSGVEVLGVILSGRAEIREEQRSARSQREAGALSAFRAPGAGFEVHASKGARLLLAVVTRDGSPIAGRGPAKAWTSRPAPIAAFHFAERRDLAWAGGALHARLGLTPDDAAPVSLNLLRFSPRASVAPHQHTDEWECIAILEGAGDLARRYCPADPEIVTRLAAGDSVCIPPGLTHAFRGTGPAPFTAVQLYSPPGPEQRFEKLAAQARSD